MGSRKRTVFIAAGAVVLLVGGAGVGYAFHKQRVLAAACDSVTAYAEQTGGVVHYPGDGSRIVIIGDSYTTGDHLTDRQDAWPHKYAEISGADVYVLGEGGTGYANAGFFGTGRFHERLDAAVDLKPDTLVIAGGLNDVGQPVQDAAQGLLEQATSEATVIVVGPVDVPAIEGEAAVSEELEHAARAAGATFVPAMEWDVDFLADGVHLTPEGHERYADLFADHTAKTAP